MSIWSTVLHLDFTTKKSEDVAYALLFFYDFETLDQMALACWSRSAVVSNKLGTLTPDWSKGTLSNTILATAFAERNDKAIPPPLKPAKIHWDCLPGILPTCGSPSGVAPWTTVALSVLAFKHGMVERTHSRSRCSPRLYHCPSSP